MTIYLDYNATAPMRSLVKERMQELLGLALNASSQHALGRRARGIIEDSRRIIAGALNCFPDEVIFCASGTEANNWALRSFPHPGPLPKGEGVIVSAIEHASVLKAVAGGGGEGIPVTKDGVVDLEALERKLKSPPLMGEGRREGDSPHKSPPLPNPLPQGERGLVSIMLANNETGVMQPVAEAAKIAKQYGALLHCDVVQAFGKIPVDFSALGVDMMTVSAHKMGGPVGAAALIIRRGLNIEPMFKGGGQESNRRAGTENVAAIAGFATAVELMDFAQMERLRGWLRDAEMQVSETPSSLRGSGLGEGVAGAGFDSLTPTHSLRERGIVFGAAAPRLPNTACIAMPGVSAETQLIAFDLEGIAVSAGSACTSGRIEPSHVLKAMGVDEKTAATAIRVSGGWNTTEADVRAFAGAWKKLYERKASAKAAII